MGCNRPAIANRLTLSRTILFVLLSMESAGLEAAALSETALLRLDQTAFAEQHADVPVVREFESRSGVTYLLEVTQHGLDFTVEVEDPRGRKQIFNSPLKRDEREYVVLDGAAAGRYRITVVSHDLTNGTGGHSVRISEIPTSVGKEQRRLAAWRLMSRAALTNAAAEEARRDQNEGETLYFALKRASRYLYQEASQAWQRLDEVRFQAQALFSMAMIDYWSLSDWALSEQLAGDTAALYQTLGERALGARADFLQASALVERAGELGRSEAEANFETALETYEQVREFQELADNPFAVAEVLNFIGYTHHLRGDLQEARKAWKHSTSLFSSGARS